MPAPTTAAVFTGYDCSVFRNIRNFCRFALTEEHVNKRLRLIREKTLSKQFSLDLAPFLEGQLGSGFDGVNRSQRRYHVALFLAGILTRGGEDWGVLLGRAELVVTLASSRCTFRRDFAGEGNCAREQIAFNQPIENTGLQRIVRFDRIALRAHLDRFCHTGEAGQPL